jgi:hypothetical protein
MSISTSAAAGPVRWDDQMGAVEITGFAEASSVLRGVGWSSDIRTNPLMPPDVQDLPPGSMLFADPPDHTRLRGLVAPAFTPKAIGTLRPRITAIVDAVLDGLPELSPPVDVLADIGYPVTLAVMAELLDVGPEGAHLFADHTPDLVRMLEIDAGSDDLMASAVSATELMIFLTSILVERRSNPGDDFISTLLKLPGLDLQEVMSTCVLLLAAGHETTANLVANSTLALLTHPEQIPHLLADPPRAVEELLRLHGAVSRALRTATTDHDLAGQPIRAGQAVVVNIQQANRDPNRFPNPTTLDLTRAPAGHLAFGAGPHFCLGAALARLEATEILTRLFTRHPGLALTGQPTRWRDSSTFHALAELPVELT